MTIAKQKPKVVKSIFGNHSNLKQVIHRLLALLRNNFSWIAIILICVAASRNNNSYRFSRDTHIESKIIDAFKSSHNEENPQEAIDALNNRIGQLLNQLVAVRYELYEVQNSRQRLKTSVANLNDIITANENKIDLLRTRMKAKTRATSLLKEKLNESKATESSLTHNTKLLERDFERLVRANSHAERMCRKLEQECARLEKHIADKAQCENTSRTLSVDTSQQYPRDQHAKPKLKRNDDKSTQCDDVDMLTISAVNDRVSLAAIALKYPNEGKECELSVLRKKNNASNNTESAFPFSVDDAGSSRVSKLYKHPCRLRKNLRSSNALNVLRGLESLYTRPQPVRSLTTIERVLELKEPYISVSSFRHTDSSVSEKSTINLTNQSEEEDLMQYLLTLPELPPSPPVSISSPENDMAATLKVRETFDVEEAMVIESFPIASSCILKSSDNIHENNSVEFNQQKHQEHEKEDTDIIESSIQISIGFDNVIEVPPLIDVDMHEEDISNDIEMEQNNDYGTIVSSEEAFLTSDSRNSAQIEPHDAIVIDDQNENHVLSNNISQALNKNIFSLSTDETVVAAVASPSPRNILEHIPNLQQISSQPVNDPYEPSSSVIVSCDETLNDTIDEESPITINDSASIKDEADSLDYLFEGGPEDLRDLFPEGLDDVADIPNLSSEILTADINAVPSLVEIKAELHDKSDKDIASTSEESETSITSRKYRKSKRNPLACLRPNVPGWSIPWKGTRPSEGIFTGKAAHVTSEVAPMGRCDESPITEIATSLGESSGCSSSRLQSEQLADIKDTRKTSLDKTEQVSAEDSKAKASLKLAENAKSAKNDDCQEKDREDPVLRGRSLGSYGSKESQIKDDRVDLKAEKVQHMGRQLDNLKRRRSIHDVNEDIRCKKPETDSERSRNSRPEADGLCPLTSDNTSLVAHV